MREIAESESNSPDTSTCCFEPFISPNPITSFSRVPNDSEEFAIEVQRVNQEFPASYHLLFGKQRCSCGFAFNLY
ncbi:hypothetical protein [Pseudoneobacillus rhizosphaerae]|uniref:Uncharacterized protein n=1 Tax=Pseudoneobacillus rhizosphaerae TaxID=2880968 RepID=A0A9C7LCF7_9BACI|nr:hypothetical protein [Pseudoneobacillus rhizosphaerae]CAG9609903.1 hypothetical protein NEOCIP111885_03646 [Pseudoneobacillus rhizosphaerae]